MNIRQFQIFRQDLTNFNILEIGKKIGTCPCVGHPYFLVLFVWGFILPYEQNRIRTGLALCGVRPKNVRSSGDLLLGQPSRCGPCKQIGPFRSQYRACPLVGLEDPQQPQMLGWRCRWHRVLYSPKKSVGKHPKGQISYHHSVPPHGVYSSQM